MSMNLGKPTEYGYELPAIRYRLCAHAIESLPGSARMLDYGCGNGANTVLFKQHFERVDGIDVEAARVQEGSGYLTSNAVTNVDLATYDGGEIPFDEKTFDMVTSFEVLEHVSDDTASLKDICRVLKENGRLCISVPNKWYLMETHGFSLPLAHLIPWNRVPFLNLMPKWFYRRWGNARIYTRKEIFELLIDAGFVIVGHSYIKPPFDIVKSAKSREWLSLVYRQLPAFMGVSLFVECRKR